MKPETEVKMKYGGWGLVLGAGAAMIVGATRQNEGKGAAYVFSRNAQSGAWTQTARIVADDVQAGDGFGASLHLEFAEDSPIVPFDRTQGEEKPCANLAIRESLGNELEYFQLACAQWFNQGISGKCPLCSQGLGGGNR